MLLREENEFLFSNLFPSDDSSSLPQHSDSFVDVVKLKIIEFCLW